ncbi:MAG: ABC transporter substrate-binding protein [Allorhizobium sp.]
MALILMTLFAAGIAGPALAADTEGAIAAVKRIHANTVEASKASAGRKVAQLSALLDKYLDLNEIASRVLGKAWDGASAGERQDFKRVLRDVMAVELSRKIRPDDRFAISGAKAINDRDVVVFSHQTRKDGSDRRLDWKMRPCRTSFCIFDLVGNGASLSVARRDEYAARLRALGGSLAALTRSIRAEIDVRP